jgi:hypothetical protein
MWSKTVYQEQPRETQRIRTTYVNETVNVRDSNLK